MTTIPTTILSPFYVNRIQVYLRGRLEYSRFIRQAQRIEVPSKISALPELSVLDFYPSDIAIGNLEQDKIIILSYYDGEIKDEEILIAILASFLQHLTHSSLFPNLKWIIGAPETELESINLLLSYALLAGSMDEEEIDLDIETSEDFNIDLNLENHIQIISSEDIKALEINFILPFDVFWSGLGSLDSLHSETTNARQILPCFILKEGEDLNLTLVKTWEKFQKNCQILAKDSFQKQNWKQSEIEYKRSLRYGGLRFVNWNNLAIVYLKQSRFNLALKASQISIEQNPNEFLSYYILGLITQEIGELESAIKAFNISLSLNPKHSDSYASLGLSLEKLDDRTTAKIIYIQGIQKSNGSFGLYLNAGNLAFSENDFKVAEELYCKALEIQPENIDVLIDLVHVTKHQGKKSISDFYYRRRKEAISKNPLATIQHCQMLKGKQLDDIQVYHDLLTCYEVLKNYDSLLETIQDMIHRFDVTNHLIELVSSILLQQKYVKKFNNLMAHYLPQADPRIQEFAKSRLFPVIYNSVEETQSLRHRFEQALKSLQDLDVGDNQIQCDLWSLIESRTNFYLAYQGYNDRDLQCEYSHLITKLSSYGYSQYQKPLRMPSLSKEGKIKIGYVSAHFRSHNGTQWALGWLKYHDRQKFEVHCYSLDPIADDVTNEFKQYSDYFHRIETCWQDAAKIISNDGLHILIFPDIGMEVQTLLMCNLRLAPIQCTAWGHPVTSGSDQVDYYLSGDAMEPVQAQDHYRETLVRLPHLGLCYEKPQLPDLSKTRLDFRISEDCVFYYSCQGLLKYLPQYDFIYPEIARRVPSALFVFLDRDDMGKHFMNRLQRSFEKYNLLIQDYCLLLPFQPRSDYLSLMMLADVYLDTLGWSGGNTTMDAVACGLPIVTCPGEFMRGRHSYGILNTMNITETIAQTPQHYIEIASQLGLDPQQRYVVREKLLARQKDLYENRNVVYALDRFLENAVHNQQLLEL